MANVCWRQIDGVGQTDTISSNRWKFEQRIIRWLDPETACYSIHSNWETCNQSFSRTIPGHMLCVLWSFTNLHVWDEMERRLQRFPKSTPNVNGNRLSIIVMTWNGISQASFNTVVGSMWMVDVLNIDLMKCNLTPMTLIDAITNISHTSSGYRLRWCKSNILKLY